MISDTLSDALAEVRRYRTELPDVYAAAAADLDDLQTAMERVLRLLDTPGAYERNLRRGEAYTSADPARDASTSTYEAAWSATSANASEAVEAVRQAATASVPREDDGGPPAPDED